MADKQFFDVQVQDEVIDVLLKMGNPYRIICYLLQIPAPQLSPEQRTKLVAAIFPIVEEEFLELKPEVFRGIVEMANCQQLQSFLNKNSHELQKLGGGEHLLRIVQERLSVIRPPM
jgi:hypothetical protein